MVRSIHTLLFTAATPLLAWPVHAAEKGTPKNPWALGMAGTTRTLLMLLLAIALAGCGQSLHDLAARGDLEGIREKLSRDPAALNSRDVLDKTPLHHAVSNKRIEAMALLVEAGAEVNAQDKTGLTPLHVAAMQGRQEEAAWLLDHGADLEARDTFGDTPVHTAAVYGMGGGIQVLHRRGASLTLTNNDGHTPLDLARKYRHERVVAYLEKLTGNAE